MVMLVLTNVDFAINSVAIVISTLLAYVKYCSYDELRRAVCALKGFPLRGFAH